MKERTSKSRFDKNLSPVKKKIFVCSKLYVGHKLCCCGQVSECKKGVLLPNSEIITRHSIYLH